MGSYDKTSYRILKRGPGTYPVSLSAVLSDTSMKTVNCNVANLVTTGGTVRGHNDMIQWNSLIYQILPNGILHPSPLLSIVLYINGHCPACRTYLIATRFWVVVICPIIKCLTVLEFSFILFDLCLFITIFNFILNYVPIVTFWIFIYHKIWILFIIFCFIWNYWIIYFLTCLEVFWSVMS